MDFDFQYLEKFEKDLFASTLEWKEYLVNVDGVLDESLIRNELANRISDHFRENMSKLIEERREKWTGVANVSRSHLVDNHATHDLGKSTLVKTRTFKMGSPKTSFFRKNAVRDDDESQYQVTLTKGFYLGHEVTQGQWESVMGSNPSEFKGTNRPVEKVSDYLADAVLPKAHGDGEAGRQVASNGMDTNCLPSYSNGSMPVGRERRRSIHGVIRLRKRMLTMSLMVLLRV